MRTWSVALGLVLAASFSCSQDDPIDVVTEDCPNTPPQDGAPCPRAGLLCNYFTSCDAYYPARCEDDGRWSFQDGCPAQGGAGGGGGDGGASSSNSSSSSSSSSASVGGGGSGGSAGGAGGSG